MREVLSRSFGADCSIFSLVLLCRKEQLDLLLRSRRTPDLARRENYMIDLAKRISTPRRVKLGWAELTETNPLRSTGLR